MFFVTLFFYLKVSWCICLEVNCIQAIENNIAHKLLFTYVFVEKYFLYGLLINPKIELVHV